MRNDNGTTEASQQYAAAYATHYETKDLPRALELYKVVVLAHPDTTEAGYSRSQIQNIVTRAVPKEELLDAGVDLALACFERDKSKARRAASGHATRVAGFQAAHPARSSPMPSDPPSLMRPQSGRTRARQVSSTAEEGD